MSKFFKDATPEEKRKMTASILRKHLSEIEYDLQNQDGDRVVIEIMIAQLKSAQKRGEKDVVAEIVMSEYLLFTINQKVALMEEIREQLKTLEGEFDVNKMA